MTTRPRRRSAAVSIGVAAGLLLSVVGTTAAATDRGSGDDIEPAAPDAPTAATPAGDIPDAVVEHLRARGSAYGVNTADVADLEVVSSYRSSHNGVTHVTVNQRHEDLEVFGAYATVNVADDGEVLFVGHSLVEGLSVGPLGAPKIDALEAVEAAAKDLDLPEPDGVRVLSRRAGPERETVLSGGEISDEPIPARLGWQPTDDGLRLAWQSMIDDATDAHLWNVTVDADSGDVLAVDDWTSHDDVEEVAAGLARRDGPWSRESAGVAQAEAAPEVAEAPKPTAATEAVMSPDPVEDGSSYRVFALPNESPNDGPQTVVTNPADALGSPFGWHDTDGVAGADHTVTRGNNVHAYTDRDGNNVVDPTSDPDGSDDLGFDFEADLTEHAHAYSDAAVTNLFYWNNIVHDVMYRYGFDEAAGNFQADNLGRGGVGGDPVRAEAQDGSGENNANFTTPPVDGTGVPRMQMYVFPGLQYGLPNAVTIDTGTAAGTYEADYAPFTPAVTNTGVSGEIVLVDDGAGAPNDGCTAYEVPEGAIAVLDNSWTCSHYTRVANAEKAGAAAVIVAHHLDGVTPFIWGSMDPPVGIPAVVVTQADGATIKAGLPATGSVQRNADRLPIRDGDLDNGIIVHEYGHGVSLRLTGGPTVNCLTGVEQAGEGWSDFLALALLLDPSRDDPESARGMGAYAQFEDTRGGAGIRPAPYSRNMEIQPFTYDSIKSRAWLEGSSLSVPHGVGHGWAAVLWDMTWDLIDKHGFNADVYGAWDSGGNNRAIQYVIDGLKFQGCSPGLVDSRDAIIAAADVLSDGEDTCTIWAAFARRGLGYSAVQGAETNRNDNREAFDTHPDCRGGWSGGVSDQPTMNAVRAGSTQPMVFSAGGDHGADVLAENAPYSRQVNCTTLQTEDPDADTVTPRPIPVAAQAQGGGLSYDADEDRYTYPWRTVEDWDGTCREFVLTRTDGVQHRAYFRFTSSPSHRVSGYVRDTDDEPLAGAKVTVAGVTATTDANGFYSFDDGVARGTYDATATAVGCHEPLTRSLTVRKPTTLDFSLPDCTTLRVSVAADGTEGNDSNYDVALSADGRYVVFSGESSNLVVDDTNRVSDVFVRDWETGTVERVSVAGDGTQGDGHSYDAALSADGRYVAFLSYAANLVPGDTNGLVDVFVHDRETGTTERVSVADDGAEGDGSSTAPSISADGRYIAFESSSSTLVDDDTNGTADVFVHDRETGATERVSVADDGTQADGSSSTAAVSADGRYVAFRSYAANLVADDTNNAPDVFVHDRETGLIERVSVAGDGSEGDASSGMPSISGDGRFVAFESYATLDPDDTNWRADVYVHDRETGSTEWVSHAGDGGAGDLFSNAPSLSADGRYVAFDSASSNLVEGDTNDWTDVFLHDRETGETRRVSVASDGTEGDHLSSRPTMSPDGRFVGYLSLASNLVAGDGNASQDAFVWDRMGPGAEGG